MSSRTSITLYYDLVSPYSYYAVKLLARYSREQWSHVDVVMKPVFLPGIFGATKNQAPAAVAAKGAYMMADLNRVSAASGIPFNFPSEFPLMTVQPMRLLIAIEKKEPAKYQACLEKLYDTYWVEDKNITEVKVILAALTPILGEAKVQEYLKMTSDQEIKQALIDNTNESVEKGAFGVPTFVGRRAGSDEEELFFGADRFEIMANTLGLPYPGLSIPPPAKL